MGEFPMAAMVRLLKNSGATRVSEDAAKAMAEACEDYAMAVSEAAIALANHAGRKTVKKEDVKLAVK